MWEGGEGARTHARTRVRKEGRTKARQVAEERKLGNF